MTPPAKPSRIVKVRSIRRPPPGLPEAWFEEWDRTRCCCCGAGLSRWVAMDEHGQTWGKACIDRALGRLALSARAWTHEQERAENARLKALCRALAAAHAGQAGTRYVFGNLGSATLYASGVALADDDTTPYVFGDAHIAGRWFSADEATLRAKGMQLPRECLAEWLAEHQHSTNAFRAKGDEQMARYCLGEIERLKADYAGWDR